MGERERVTDRQRKQQPQHAERVSLVPGLARQEGEPQERERSRRITGRDWRVLEVLASHRQLLLILSSREEPPMLLILEPLDQRVGQPDRFAIPPRVE